MKSLNNPGSSSGRTPALTSVETYVRIVDRDHQKVGPKPLERQRTRIVHTGLGPEFLTSLSNIGSNSETDYSQMGMPKTLWIGPMANVLPRKKQIEIIAALTEGCSISTRASEGLTGAVRLPTQIVKSH